MSERWTAKSSIDDLRALPPAEAIQRAQEAIVDIRCDFGMMVDSAKEAMFPRDMFGRQRDCSEEEFNQIASGVNEFREWRDQQYAALTAFIEEMRAKGGAE